MKYTWNDILSRVDSLELNGSSVVFLPQLIDHTVNIAVLPERFNGITHIADYAFFGCKNLSLTSLPDGIISIGKYAFHNCKNLSLTSLPSSVTHIRDYAFEGSSLTELTFQGTPETIASNAFGFALRTINVPWSEGTVANAPWGAVNATINYNYTGE